MASCLSTLLTRLAKRGDPLKPEHVARANFLKVAIPPEAQLPDRLERTVDDHKATLRQRIEPSSAER